jgi:hypothetical protein
MNKNSNTGTSTDSAISPISDGVFIGTNTETAICLSSDDEDVINDDNENNDDMKMKGNNIGTNTETAICLSSDDEDVIHDDDKDNDNIKMKGNEDVINDDNEKNKNKKKEGNKPVLSYSSGSELSFHSSSDEGREWFDDHSAGSVSSVSCHSSDTSEEEYTGYSRMTVHKTPTSRKYLKRKEKVRCAKAKAFKKKFSKLRMEKRQKRQKRSDDGGASYHSNI